MADTSTRYHGKEHTYDSEAVTVTYDVKRCIHYKACVRGLPDAFDPEARPWIAPDAADPDALATVVLRCPTGALHFSRTDGGPEETPAATARLQVATDGPVYARGHLHLQTPDGEVVLEDTRVALCRCGASGNKPFCDNSHHEIDFRAAGSLGTSKLHAGPLPDASADEESTTLVVTLAANGPLLLAGPFELRDAAGGQVVHGAKAALCRCGGSSNKPFCDGTHADNGFEVPPHR